MTSPSDTSKKGHGKEGGPRTEATPDHRSKSGKKKARVTKKSLGTQKKEKIVAARKLAVQAEVIRVVEQRKK